ncbi:ribosomal RNA small subunit methyltransferase A [Candidatus Kuenenbacteria bacterium]|nr:ribosomal RNA small subunit methyltransferase A [Candidatus Kuenenbacteria bacterium]
MEQKSLLDKTKELCRKLEIVPTRSKGQNFLVSREVLDKIVAAANLGPEDLVLEIGPGLGILTEELVRRARRVVAVELDKKLFSYLSEKFKSVNNLDLVEGDIIKLLNYQIVKLLGNKNYKVVANLPYQITAHILRLLLESAPTAPARELATPPRAGGEITEMVLMVQKEVGERICAKRGDMSVLAVMVQYYGQPEMVGIVGKENFWPVPEVDSAIIKIKRQKSKGKIKEELFFKLVKVGFSGKRKMLKNNLRNIYDEKNVLAVLAELGLDAKARAEDLGVEEWIKLYRNLNGACLEQHKHLCLKHDKQVNTK